MSLPIDVPARHLDDPFPPLPFDISARLMHFCLYDGNEFSPYLQADDLVGDFQDVSRRQAIFARNFLGADKAYHRVALRLLNLSLFVSAEADIQRLQIAADRVVGSDPSITYGSLTKRLEVRSNSVNLAAIPPLLAKLPNLQIFILRTSWGSPGLPRPTLVEGALPAELVRWNPKLLRLQLESPLEFANPSILRSVLVGLTSLISLHAAYVVQDETSSILPPIDLPLDTLQELSIGTGPPFNENHTAYRPPGDFLHLFESKSLLPRLECLHIQGAVPSTREFLQTFGSNIQVLCISSVDDDFVAGSPPQHHLVSMCPRLRELIIKCPQGFPPGLIDHLPHTDTITRVLLVHVPRLRVSSWGQYFVLRHALRFGGLYDQTALREICILADRSSSIQLGKTTWFPHYREDLRSRDVAITGISTFFPD